MNNTALIFGAGKTGRGFAAHLAHLGGYDIILIDKNKQLVDVLKRAGEYTVQVMGDEGKNSTIRFSGVYSVDDTAWYGEMINTPVAFTAVFGNNLEALSRDLAIALDKRFIENPNAPLTVITCENLTNAASLLKDSVLENLGLEKKKWLSDHVGFSESIIFNTCLSAGPGQSPLTIRAQDYFELPLDGDAIKAPLHVFGLKPLYNFKHQLKRKIYTYNCINAVITYLGAQKGYKELSEAGNDSGILLVARKAASETSNALVAEFRFDPEEQDAWVNAAFAKFSDTNIPDPIERNGADAARKLSREDRLIGPALLALKHGIHPEALLQGIIAAVHYFSKEGNTKMLSPVTEKDLHAMLKNVCGLSKDEHLFSMIKEKYIRDSSNGQ